jgi:UDP-apiose/xylose synthase
LNILILGGGGFIGSHLAQRLLLADHAVTVVDTHDDKIRESLAHPRLTFRKVDIRAPDCDLQPLIRGTDLVVDLIAHANPGTYVGHPLDVFRLNFTENLKIAETCVRERRRLIQFSSCEVHGKSVAALLGDELTNPEDPRYALFSEDSSPFILGPVNKHRWIYACAKQLLERVLHAYGLDGSLNYSIVRPFNFIGPKIDYLPHEAAGIPRVFSCFMEALLRGESLKLVDGGRHRRCYIYIDDAMDAVARIVENVDSMCDRQIINIGNPANETSIRDLATLMRELFEEKRPARNRRASEIVETSASEFYGEGYDDSDRRIPDIAKARRLLRWEPKMGLREALERTMAYYMR